MTLEQQMTALLKAATDFGQRAFSNGHYPNPLSHSVVGCELCRVAKAAEAMREVAEHG